MKGIVESMLSSRIRFFTLHALLLAGIGSQFGNGCATSSEPTRDDRYNEPYSSRDDDRYEDYSNRIPSDARLIKEGVGDISFRAGSNGRFWLYDERDRKVLYYDDLLDGDDVIVSPKEDRVYINKRSVEKLNLSSERVHRLYFDGRRAYGDKNRPGGYDRPGQDRPGQDRPGHDRPRPEEPRPSKPTSGVPDSAKLVAESRSGGDVSYKAPTDGRAYLYDNSNNKLVQSFSVRKGQRLTVSPANDLATLDGKTVMQRQGLSKRASYRLLFAE